MTQASERNENDQVRLEAERVAALRQAVEECYCGLGPACHLWRALSPEERRACSLDKRAAAQALWMNGM